MTKAERLQVYNKQKRREKYLRSLKSENCRLRRIWSTMKNRCYNPKAKRFNRYGGRGISVCDEWLHRSKEFICWARANGYNDNLQLDRIDNDKGYSPDNCRWVTVRENSRNRRSNKQMTIDGITTCAADWSITLGISQFTIYWWIREKGIQYAEQRISDLIKNKVRG